MALGGTDVTDPPKQPDSARLEAAAEPGADDARAPSRLVRIMRALARAMPRDPSGENPVAVHLFRRLDAVRDLMQAGPIRRRLRRHAGIGAWPPEPGAYRVGDVTASVAVCTLSSRELIEPVAALPGVAIAGRLITVNLGIERMVGNLVSNPRIRALILCGKDSPVFHTAQALQALVENGLTAERRIIGAHGHWPVLDNLSVAQIARFRHQITLVDAVGISDLAMIARHVEAAAERVAAMPALPVSSASLDAPTQPRFKRIAAGGRRSPLAHDPCGFFVITLDQPAREIVCQHYSADHVPLHEVRSQSAERVLLALVRENLVSELSHAGYLGAELGKAETALRLGLRYEQDRALRQR
jgi:tetrahydromethanopterin S-methyltransferase subunit A